LSHTLLRRTALFSLILPFLYFGTASATFLYRIHAENSARTNVKLPLYPAPDTSQKILIFSPHPDDETLGCAGLIQQATSKGVPIHVVMLTNGDGFRVAVERQFRQLQVQPSDYVQFASVRQQEVRKALMPLGIERDNITFLGYPDRGLLSLWNHNWSADKPYTSPYTRANSSPYSVGYRKNAVYCGQGLLNDLKEILRERKPTDVYVTHPSDDHIDHTAASSFVTLALEELKREDKAFVDCKLHYFLIHRGDWPAPQGMYKTDSLVPPSEMVSLDTVWKTRPLTPAQVERKSESILSYESQTSVMKKFLTSFARSTEIYGTLKAAPVPEVSNGKIKLDGDVSEWESIPAAALDPVNDNLLRDFQGGGDVRAIYACHDSSNLYLRIETHEPVSDRVEFQLGVRYFGEQKREEAGGSFTVTVKPGSSVSPADVREASDSTRLEIAIPLRKLGYTGHFALNVDSFFAGIQVDRTGYRFMDMH
jgi:LmbE family N-acetylglucosaminyl deacetylase